jgi:alkanesulfonate monooxygenase SsuD/methylene tetrahydromethanopterin reductase-like flavin-dependent oxidoreductase (luciferase family)
MGPRNVALAAEIADGWMPYLYAPERADIFAHPLETGWSRGGRDQAAFDVAPVVAVAFGDDVGACRDELRPRMARYVGGMGSRDANFYKDAVGRYGFADAAERIQEAFLNGRRAEATALVPDAMVDELCLAGPVERVRERLGAWRGSGVTTLLCETRDVEAIRTLAEAAS